MAAERTTQPDNTFERAYEAAVRPTTSLEIIQKLVAQATDSEGDN